MICNDTLFKLLASTRSNPERIVFINNEVVHIIEKEEFSQEEIEELRDLDRWEQENGHPPFIANFLPDDIRPAGVKKL